MVGSLTLFGDVGIRNGRNGNDLRLNPLDKSEWMRTERLLLCLESGASVTSGRAMSTGQEPSSQRPKELRKYKKEV